MADPRPRLLFLSPLPPPAGGIAYWMVAIRESPLRERFELRVVNSSPSSTGAVQQGSRFRLDRVADAVRILARFSFELARFRPRIVHVNTSYFWAFLRDGLAVWLASFAGARTLLHFHGGDFPEFVAAARPSARRWIEATLRRADGLIALTEHTRVYLASVAPPERVHYVPNFVRLEDFDPVPVRGAGGGPVEILYVGWLLEAKGVRELVQAVRGLPKARLTLVGPEDPAFVASLRPDLEALGERVRVLPPRPREEVRKLYRDADLLALPTWREGFPTVVLEAMAAGLPLVATPVGAIPEAVRDGEDGLLVPPRDLPALRGALGRLVDDPALRADLGGRARARAEALYSQTAVVRLLASLYAELLPGS